MAKEIILQSAITYPECRHQEIEAMPIHAYQWLYECKECGALLKPKLGDCCVFCSCGGTVSCSPIQEEQTLAARNDT